MQTKLRNTLALMLSIGLLYACAPKKSEEVPASVLEEVEENVPLPGFDVAGSDADAIMIADKVMRAMGGRKAWDDTHYIRWNFFGRRTLLWDKYTGDVRIEFVDSDEKILVNIHTLEGQVYKDGQEMTNTDSLASYLKKGKSIWINDSYWLVMPFKLKDTGVSLYYTGSDTTELGSEAYVLQLVFDSVGDTPHNVYHVWVDVESDLITQWAYYQYADHPSPQFITPWAAYQKHGDIMLSGNRGKNEITEIAVFDEVPKEAFISFDAISFNVNK